MTLVENSGPVWGLGDAWILSAEPTLRIGVADGDPEYQLFGVGGVSSTSDGRLLVLNRGSNEIRVFDSQGSFLQTVGREGDGPGEFQNLSWITVMPGDSIMAWDFRARRISVFTPDGEFIRSGLFDRYLQIERRLPDGSIVVFNGATLTETPPDGVYRGETYWRRLTEAGALVDTVTVQPTQANLVKTEDFGVSFGLLPFDTWPLVTFHDSGFAIANRSEYRIDLFTLDGDWIRSIRRRGPNRPITEADVERFYQTRLERIDPTRHAEVRRSLEEFPIPESLPAHSELRFDPLDHLWVKDVQGVPEILETENRWSVFDPEGRWLGNLTLPAGMEVHEIGADYILGVVEDEFEVEYVVRYELNRN